MTKDERFGFSTVEIGQCRYTMARSEYERVRQTWENYLGDRERQRFYGGVPSKASVTFEDNHGGMTTVALSKIEAMCDYPPSALAAAADEKREADIIDGGAGVG